MTTFMFIPFFGVIIFFEYFADLREKQRAEQDRQDRIHAVVSGVLAAAAPGRLQIEEANVQHMWPR